MRFTDTQLLSMLESLHRAEPEPAARALIGQACRRIRELTADRSPHLNARAELEPAQQKPKQTRVFQPADRLSALKGATK